MNAWMTASVLDGITEELRERLSPRRFAHVLGVCHTVVRLAVTAVPSIPTMNHCQKCLYHGLPSPVSEEAGCIA